jgi:MoxR-like ATPase
MPPAPGVGTTPMEQVLYEVKKVIVGQDHLLERMIVALLARGHLLVEGVPGLAKTMAIKTLAASIGGDFKRIQFTPDLVPADLVGTRIYNQKTGEFSTSLGPVFTNLLLADEINRTPPKTQASLLEAMEERQVTIDGVPHALPDPFLVIATQNPIEYEGTYPLPEAQLDRFMLKLLMPVPERDVETEVVRRHANGFNPRDLKAAGLNPVASPADLERGRKEVAGVEVSEDVMSYIVDLCRATRDAPSVSLGVSPRGATALLATSRAWAWMRGRTFVSPDDVKSLAAPTLGHRIQLRAEAELEGVTIAAVLDSVLASVPVPK